jgi:hypothetical protein
MGNIPRRNGQIDVAGWPVVLKVEGMTLALDPTVRPVEPLTQRQLALEEESIHAGIATYRNRTARLEEGHRRTDQLRQGARAADHRADDRGHHQVHRRRRVEARPKHLAVAFLEAVPAGRGRLHHRQGVFDGITSAAPTRGVAMTIAAALRMRSTSHPSSSRTSPLFNGVKKNLENHPMGYQQRVRTSMLKHTAKKFDIQWSRWGKTDKLHLGSKLIDLFIESVGLVTSAPQEELQGHHDLPSAHRGTDEVDHGQQGDERGLCPLLLPMIAPPRDWTTPTNGGYYDKRLRRKLVKSRNKGYQQELWHREMPTCTGRSTPCRPRRGR